MSNRKYLVGLVGLALGFIVSFFLTQNYNKTNAGPGPNQTASATASAESGGGQQAMMGQVQQIIEKARKSPNDFDSQVEAAGVFDQIGRRTETVDYLKKAYAIDPIKFGQLRNALGFIADYYFSQKNYDEAETWFTRAIKAEPGDADLYVALAEAYVQREPAQPDQAIAQLQQALKVDPKSGHALGHLIEAYALKKDARSAEETLNRLKQTDPTNQRIASLESMVADLKAGKPVSIPKE